MTEISVKVLNAQNEVVTEKKDTGELNLFVQREYEQGDRIVLNVDPAPQMLFVSFDDALERSYVLVTGEVEYVIPFEEKRLNLSPKAFKGDKHLITVRAARDYEVSAYRNVALNTCDGHKVSNMFPHAVANVETRGESVFEAKNAIDGITINESHGEWPYASWGINRQDDALIRIDLGRTVEADRVILYTRADFPHDNWWTSVRITLSDGSIFNFEMEKSYKPHELVFEKKKISWVEMSHMIKADDPSPFPALTQIEVWGRDI